MNKVLTIVFTSLVSLNSYAAMNTYNTMGMIVKYQELCGTEGRFFKVKVQELSNRIKNEGFDVNQAIKDHSESVNYGYGVIEGSFLYGTLVSNQSKSEVCDLIDSAVFG
ncbi:hypothetical protein [Marinomonas sp.]